MKTLNRKQIFVKYEVAYIENWERKTVLVFAPDSNWEQAKAIASKQLNKLNKNFLIAEAKRIYA